MKRKKQGAALIVVVILFMFVSTVSMAMLSMVAGNYKARVAESKRVENLYASDSGLDVAYNIVAKTFDAAAKYAYYEVEALSTTGNAKSSNNDEYQALKTDIINLDHDITTLSNNITTLKAQTSTDAIKAEIVRKNNLIVQKKILKEEDENLKQLLLNEEFKRTFKNFIAATSYVGRDEIAPDKLEKSIEANEYVSEANFVDNAKTINFNGGTADFDTETIDFAIENKNAESPILKVEKCDDHFGSLQTVTIRTNNSVTLGDLQISAGHSVALENLPITKSADKDYYNIWVTSTFYTEKVNVSNNTETTDDDYKTTNERKLQANFKMSIPNYKDIYFQNTTGELQEYLALKDRALTIYGDMSVNNVTGSNGLNVDGEIFVEGKEPTTITTANRAFQKYDGGIIISNSSNVKFNDDVITRNTFNVRDNANVTIDGNLYGRNVYMGGVYVDNNLSNGLGDFATGSTLNANSKVVIDNDLGLKAKDSTINIKDFYGVNDKTIDSKDATGVLVDKVKTASSIIVNSYDTDNSKINITDSAFIMGTAHINTNENNDGNRYQTGESGAIKGNYIAYSVPVPFDNTSEKFVYYDPLQLLDESNVITKAEHFKGYWEGQISKGINPNVGVITWPQNADGSINSDKVYSIGALVYEADGIKNVVGSTYYSNLEEPGGDVYNEKEKFAIKVYKFDQSATKEYEYDKTIITPFSSLIDTSKIPSYDLEDQVNEGEYAILNGDETKEIKIVKSDKTTDKITSSDDSVLIEVAKDTDNKYGLSAVIATAGKVSIESDITLKGCIIAEGDLNITGANVNINYDHGVIERVQVKNSDIFKDVFGGSLLIENTDSPSTASTSSANYDLKNFLENKSWKILK